MSLNIKVLFYGEGVSSVAKNPKLRDLKINSKHAFGKEYCFER